MNSKNMESGDFLGKTDLLPNLSPFRNAEQEYFFNKQ